MERPKNSDQEVFLLKTAEKHSLQLLDLTNQILELTKFEVNKETLAKVQRNYHVILGENNHQYSVPYQYIGKQTQIIYSNQKVEIYCGTERIAIHKRDHREHAYSTMAAHMPEKHIKYKKYV